MNETVTLQQEFTFRMSLLRLVTNTPLAASQEPAPSTESTQLENMFALVESGSTGR